MTRTRAHQLDLPRLDGSRRTKRSEHPPEVCRENTATHRADSTQTFQAAGRAAGWTPFQAWLGRKVHSARPASLPRRPPSPERTPAQHRQPCAKAPAFIYPTGRTSPPSKRRGGSRRLHVASVSCAPSPAEKHRCVRGKNVHPSGVFYPEAFTRSRGRTAAASPEEHRWQPPPPTG
jgi:hypothetical protein